MTNSVFYNQRLRKRGFIQSDYRRRIAIEPVICKRRMKKTRWDQPPRPLLQIPVPKPPLLPLPDVQANQRFQGNIPVRFDRPNQRTPPPPGTEDDPVRDPVVPSVQRNHPGNNRRNSAHLQRQSYGNLPTEPFRQCYQNQYRHSYLMYRGPYLRPYQAPYLGPYQAPYREPYQAPYLRPCQGPYRHPDNWVDPGTAQQGVTFTEKTEEEKTPLPGSAEERERTLKEKAEWLKSRMKNKDLKDSENRLEQIKRQKASEPQQESKIKSLYVPCDTSVLESDSLETVKKNLGDVLPDGGNLLTSLLKEPEAVTRIQTAREGNPDLEVVDVEDLPSRMLLKNTIRDAHRRKSMKVKGVKLKRTKKKKSVKETRGNESHSGSSHDKYLSVPNTVPLFSPNLTETRTKPSAERMHEDVSCVDTIARPNLSSTNREKRESLLDCVSKLAGIPKIKDLSQLKSLIEHPRPGKFEHYLNEQIKKYRLSSCRAVHLSDKPFTLNENVDIQEPQTVKTEDVPRQGSFSSEDLMSCLGKWSECDVRMEDLPFEFIQELGALLELDVTIPIDSNQDVDQVGDDAPDPNVVRPEIEVITCSTKPAIRVKDFASLSASTSASSQTLHPVDTLKATPATSPVARPAVSPAVSPAVPFAASPAPHPLDGPNLLAVCYQDSRITIPTCPAKSPASLPKNGQYRGRKPNILPGDVFFSGETNGKKGNKPAKSPQKPRKKSVEVLKPLVGANSHGLPKDFQSPDSTDCSEEREDVSERMSLSAGGRGKVTSKKKVTSASEYSEDEFGVQTHANPKGEANILKRIQEILSEITLLNEKLTLLEEEKDNMYNLLQKVRKNAKKRKVTEDSEEEEVRRKILSDVYADLEKSNNFDYKTRKKKSLKKASPGSKSKKEVLPAICTEAAVLPAGQENALQNESLPLEQTIPVAAKGTLGYYMQNVTLTCDKNMLPKNIGIITQIKVIKKSILASSADGKIYYISSSSGKIKKTFDCGALPVKCFCLAETKTQPIILVAGTEDGNLHCFNLTGGERLYAPIPVTNEINCVDSKWGLVYIGSKSGSISKFDILRKRLTALTAENGVIYGIKCASEGPRKVLVCASSKWGLELRNAKDALLLRRFVNWDGNSSAWGAPEYKYAVDVTADRVAFSKAGEVHILEFTNPQGTVHFKIPSHISCMHVSEGILLVGCKDGSIRRYDIMNYKVLPPLIGNKENVVCFDAVDNKVILARKGGTFDVISLLPSADNCPTVVELE